MNSFTFQITKSQVEKIKSDILEKGFLLKPLQYGFFQATHKQLKTNVSVYESMKCLVQGKGAEEFVRFYMEPEIMKSFKLDYGHLDFTDKIGMDESGKGDYFGPLAVAAVYVTTDLYHLFKKAGIMDSKRITDKRIMILAKIIVKYAKYKIIVISPEKYNELYASIGNLNRLLAWAHSACLRNLVKECDAKEALCDKFSSGGELDGYVKKMGINIKLDQKVHGEEDLAVAAASIMARYAFLNKLEALSSEYKMEFPKGAGPEVIKAGKIYVGKYGIENLKKIAKVHFKTTDEFKNIEQ